MGAKKAGPFAAVAGRLAARFERRPGGAVRRRGSRGIGRRWLEPAAQFAALLIVARALL